MRVLMLNANPVDEPVIKTLKTMGHYVITTGNRPDFKGHLLADEYVPCDFSDKERILKIAREKRVNAVCPCVSDAAVLTAAYCAEKMDLPGHDKYETSLILHNKDRFKEFAAVHSEISTPKSVYFSDEVVALNWTKNNRKFPVIVKPVDLDSGRGIAVANSEDELESAMKRAFEKSPAKRVVVEPFVSGTQHSYCAFLVNKKVAMYTSFNEYSANNNAYMVGMDCSPADRINQVAPFMKKQVELMAELLNLADGIFHVQYILDKDGTPWIIECMRRNLGNFTLKAASYQTGIDWIMWLTKAHLGSDCKELFNEPHCENITAHYYIEPLCNGRIKDVKISPKINEYIIDDIKLWHEGLEISNYVGSKIEFLFMKFSTIEERNKVIKKLHNYIKVEMI